MDRGPFSHLSGLVEIYDPLASPSFGLGPEDLMGGELDLDSYVSQLESDLLEDATRGSGESFQDGSSTGVTGRPSHWSPDLSDYDLEVQQSLLADIASARGVDGIAHPDPLFTPADTPLPDPETGSSDHNPDHHSSDEDDNSSDEDNDSGNEDDDSNDEDEDSTDEDNPHSPLHGDTISIDSQSDTHSNPHAADQGGYLSFGEETLDNPTDMPADASVDVDAGYLSFGSEPGDNRSPPDHDEIQADGYISYDDNLDAEGNRSGYMSLDEAGLVEPGSDDMMVEDGRASASDGDDAISFDEDAVSLRSDPASPLVDANPSSLVIANPSPTAPRFRSLEMAQSAENSTSPTPPPVGDGFRLRFPIPIPRACIIVVELLAEEEPLQLLVEQYNDTYLELVQMAVTRRMVERSLVHITGALRGINRD